MVQVSQAYSLHLNIYTYIELRLVCLHNSVYLNKLDAYNQQRTLEMVNIIDYIYFNIIAIQCIRVDHLKCMIE